MDPPSLSSRNTVRFLNVILQTIYGLFIPKIFHSLAVLFRVYFVLRSPDVLFGLLLGQLMFT